MIRLSRTFKYIPKEGGNDKDANPAYVVCRNVSATEFEKLIEEKPSNSEVFRRFVIEASGIVDENGEALTPSAIPDIGETAGLVNEVVAEIFSSATIKVKGAEEGDELKNE